MFAPQTAKFAVVGISESVQTSSANGGSEPSRGSQAKTLENTMFSGVSLSQKTFDFG
jgi:hypothetical protein